MLNPQETVKQIFRNMNGGQEPFVDELFKALISEHRTLQQSFFRAIKNVCHSYAETMEGCTDLRNEASLQFCKDISKLEGLPFI